MKDCQRENLKTRMRGKELDKLCQPIRFLVSYLEEQGISSETYTQEERDTHGVLLDNLLEKGIRDVWNGERSRVEVEFSALCRCANENISIA